MSLTGIDVCAQLGRAWATHGTGPLGAGVVQFIEPSDDAPTLMEPTPGLVVYAAPLPSAGRRLLPIAASITADPGAPGTPGRIGERSYSVDVTARARTPELALSIVERLRRLLFGDGTVPIGLELPTQQSPADAFGFLGRPVGLAVPYLMWRFWNIELSLAPTLNTIGSIGSQEPDGMAQAAMSITTYVVEETIAVEPPAEMSNPT